MEYLQLCERITKIVLEAIMNVPSEYRNYLHSIGFEDFSEPFVVQCYGKEYEFLSSDQKKITSFPGWEALMAVCETAIGIDACRVTKNLDELKGFIVSLHKGHGVYLKGFPPYEVWDFEKFKEQIELAFTQ